MKQWIDEKVEYLYQKIGRVPPKDFLFEPAKDFYENLGKIELIPPLEEVLKNVDEDRPPYVTFSEATKDIAKHLGRNIPRIEFHPLERKIDGRNIAGQIQIGGQSEEILISAEYKKKALQLGTILAHEITHDFLHSKGITLPDTEENEKLTDLASVMLGLGKLILNGVEEKTGIEIVRLCYLSPSDLAYAYVEINTLYEIPIENYLTNLTHAAYSLVKPFVDEINVKSARSLMDKIEAKCPGVQNMMKLLKKVYYQIKDNQELINKNVGSLKIEPDDSMVFVNLNNYSFHQDFVGFIHRESELGDIRKRLEIERKHIAVDTIQATIQSLEHLDSRISQVNKEAEFYLDNLLEALRIQEKYLHQKSGIVSDRFQELIQKGRIKEALKLAGKEDCNLLNNLGVEFAKKKDPLALEIFDRIIKLDSTDALAYYNRGNLYRDLNQQNNAITDYIKAIELNPNYANAYINRGNALVRLNLYSEAINDYTEAIRLNPNYATAYINRGNAYVSLKRYLEAINDYQMAIKLNHDDYIARDKLKEAFVSLKQQAGLIIYTKTKIKVFLFLLIHHLIFRIHRPLPFFLFLCLWTFSLLILCSGLLICTR